MWQRIIDTTLNIFANIGDFANWCFTDVQLHINLPDNAVLEWLIGWFVDWINGLNISFTPFGMFSIGTFTIFITIFVIKMIIS